MTDENDPATAAALVDTALEQAMEAVLVRYNIPAYLDDLDPHAADRGDLASDLASVARAAIDAYPVARVVPAVDFTVTVTANLDPERGAVAEGATPGPAKDADFAHVRNWVRGMILQIRGALPPGWDVDVVTLAETGAQRSVGWGILDDPIDTTEHRG